MAWTKSRWASSNEAAPMNLLFREILHSRLLWLLAFVPVMFITQKFKPEAHTLLFALSVLAIVPLAALLSHATEAVSPVLAATASVAWLSSAASGTIASTERAN